MKLELTPDELLSTTRAVRKRLDLTKPVPREVLEECFQLAQQAPTASYAGIGPCGSGLGTSWASGPMVAHALAEACSAWSATASGASSS